MPLLCLRRSATCLTIDPAVVLGAIGTLATGLGWIARRIYTDLRADLASMAVDRDEWRAIAQRATGHTDKALTIAEKKVDGG